MTAYTDSKDCWGHNFVCLGNMQKTNVFLQQTSWLCCMELLKEWKRRSFTPNECFGSLWGKRQGGRQWLTEHFRVQGTAVLKENSDDLHLIAEKPGASAGRAGQRHRWAPAPLGCHLQRAAAICSTLPQTHRKLIFWQNTGINMIFKQVALSQA